LTSTRISAMIMGDPQRDFSAAWIAIQSKQKVDEDKKEIHLWGERRGPIDGIFFYGVVEALSKVIVTAGGTLMVMFSAPVKWYRETYHILLQVSNTIHSPSPFLSLSISISQHLPNLNRSSIFHLEVNKGSRNKKFVDRTFMAI